MYSDYSARGTSSDITIYSDVVIEIYNIIFLRYFPSVARTLLISSYGYGFLVLFTISKEIFEFVF